MTNRNVSLLLVAITLLLSAGGCVTEPPLQSAQKDARLDMVVSQLDKSLANQAAANAQLQAQQQQLETQGQNLAALNQSLGKVLNVPEPVECPKAVACPPVPESSTKMVVGGLEAVWFPDLGLELTARIDTGAETASLDAREIQQFERDGKPWVRFTILNPKTDTPETLERRLVRTVGIYQSGAAEATRRPVVKLGILIGQIEQTAEFSLSDRSHMGYQVMIGRSILKDVMVVDVSRKNIAPYVRPDKKPNADGAAQ
jgi:hypothetical protein